MNTRKEVQRMTFEGADEMAAEIKRLEAQLAEVHRHVDDTLLPMAESLMRHEPDEMNQLMMAQDIEAARQALATDGKAAADVLAAAVIVGENAGRVDDIEALFKLRDAVRAYRKEGQDDVDA